MSAPALDVIQLQRLQQRVDAIRDNVRRREGRELRASEVAKLRRLLAAEIRQEARA